MKDINMLEGVKAVPFSALLLRSRCRSHTEIFAFQKDFKVFKVQTPKCLHLQFQTVGGKTSFQGDTVLEENKIHFAFWHVENTK